MKDELRPALPVLERDAAYWAALRSGNLTGLICRQCGTVRMPTLRDCPECLSSDCETVLLSGRGTVISACRFHRAYFKQLADTLPYTVVLVRLEEGPLVYSNLVEEPEMLPEPGTFVFAVIRPFGDDAALLLFDRFQAAVAPC